MLTRKLLTLLVLSTLLFSFSKPVYQANFSGTWALNEGKSELGEFGTRVASTKIVIDQKTDGVTVTKSGTNFQGEPVSTTETLANDGKESESPGFGGSIRKSTLKWAADKESLTISYSFTFQSNEFKGTEIWTISADGKTFTLQNSITTPQGDFVTKAVYDKK
jgi:hypothetical protein